MWHPDRPAICVFCGQPIEPGQPSVGRGDSAAHADCADAALKDDRYWDRMAASGMGGPAGTGGSGEVGGSGSTPLRARGRGCGILLAAFLVLAAAFGREALFALTGTETRWRRRG